MPISFAQKIRQNIQTPNQKKAYNHGLFTRVANEYDAATRAMSLGQDRRWKKQLIASLPDLRAPRCIDLACGTGDVTFELAKRFADGEIVGIDLTPPMIAVAQSRSRFPNVRFEQGDMCRLDFADAWADVVTGSYALRNAPILEQALSEVYRVLKPGGFAAFLDFVKPPSPLQAKVQMAALKYWCGIVSILVHGRPEHAYIAESLRAFPNRLALQRLLSERSFSIVHRKMFMLGFLEISILQKTKRIQFSRP